MTFFSFLVINGFKKSAKALTRDNIFVECMKTKLFNFQLLNTLSNGFSFSVFKKSSSSRNK